MNTNIYASPQATLENESAAIVPLTMKQLLFSFQGRIGRKAFWLTTLIATVVASLIIGAIFTGLASSEISETELIFILAILYIPMTWIGLAIQIKRWHDRNKSGWWVLIMFVPVIGPLWALIETGFLAGSPAANDYGSPSA